MHCVCVCVSCVDESRTQDNNTTHVRTLLQAKQCRAKLNERNEWGDTALHLAAELGNAEICQMLIAGGASVTVRNNRGETCLHRAAVGGHANAVSAIVGTCYTMFGLRITGYVPL